MIFGAWTQPDLLSWGIRLTQLQSYRPENTPQPRALAALPKAGLAALVLTTLNEVSLVSHSQNTVFNYRESVSISEVGPSCLQQVMFSLAFDVCTCVVIGVIPQKIQVGPALHLGSALATRTSGEPPGRKSRKTYVPTHTCTRRHTHIHGSPRVCTHMHTSQSTVFMLPMFSCSNIQVWGTDRLSWKARSACLPWSYFIYKSSCHVKELCVSRRLCSGGCVSAFGCSWLIFPSLYIQVCTEKFFPNARCFPVSLGVLLEMCVWETANFREVVSERKRWLCLRPLPPLRHRVWEGLWKQNLVSCLEYRAEKRVNGWNVSSYIDGSWKSLSLNIVGSQAQLWKCLSTSLVIFKYI